MRRSRLQDQVASIYAPPDAAHARRILELLPPNYADLSERLAESMATELDRVVVHRRCLFEGAVAELERSASKRRPISWGAVGDPCYSVAFSVPAGRRSMPPDKLYEAAHEMGRRTMSNVVCECWISLLIPCYVEHCYSERVDMDERSFSYSAGPHEISPVMIRARAFLKERGLRRLSFPYTLRPMKGLRARGRGGEARLFDLLFSDVAYLMLDPEAPRQPVRSIRTGSNVGHRDGKVIPGVLDAALQGLRVSWNEDYFPGGRLKSRSLRLTLPEGGMAEIVQGVGGIIKSARVLREGPRRQVGATRRMR